MRYLVTRQEVNCGPTRSIWTETPEQAHHAFDKAVQQGAIFVEMYDWQEQSQLRVEWPKAVWS